VVVHPNSDSAESDHSQKPRGPINEFDASRAKAAVLSTRSDNESRGEERGQQKSSDKEEEQASDGIQDGPGIRRPSFSTASKINISKPKTLHLVLPSAASRATGSGMISNLHTCIIDLSAATMGSPFSALYLKNIKDSLIVCGQVAGAIHITNVESSVLVITCRQFRMHGSKNVDVYLHSASRPIIEDCQNVRFAPLPRVFAGPRSDHATNQWDQIDDFKWLKAEPSPNFCILAEAQTLGEEVWRDKVQGGEDGDLEDILRAVKLI
jgi:hypothetical protein